MSIAVIIVNFGAHDLIEANTAGLGTADIVLVDNFKSPADREAARRLAREHDWQLVEAPGNPGFGGGANLGVRAAVRAGHDSVVLVNPDARVDQGALNTLSRALQSDPMALVSPTVLDSHGGVYFAGYAVVMTRGVMIRVPDVRNPPPGTGAWVSGACMAFTTAMFDRVGGFDETYFLYWEDVDFSLRAVARGAHLRVLAEATVVHDEGGTQEGRRGRAKSLLYYRYNTRNRLLLASRLLPTGTLLRWMIATPRTSYLVLLQGGRRQLLHSRKPVWAVWRGAMEGLAIATSELWRRWVSARPLGRPPVSGGRQHLR